MNFLHELFLLRSAAVRCANMVSETSAFEEEQKLRTKVDTKRSQFLGNFAASDKGGSSVKGTLAQGLLARLCGRFASARHTVCSLNYPAISFPKRLS